MTNIPPLSDRLIDPFPGEDILAEQERIQNELLRRHIGYPDTITDSTGTRMVARKTVGQVIFTCSLTADLLPGATAAATLLTGTAKTTNGGAITVKDIPASITSGKKIASGTTCRVFKDLDMDLAADEYAFLLPLSCEVDQ
jgi:hypothetical protein